MTSKGRVLELLKGLTKLSEWETQSIFFLKIAKEILLQHSPRGGPKCHHNKSMETFRDMQ